MGPRTSLQPYLLVRISHALNKGALVLQPLPLRPATDSHHHPRQGGEIRPYLMGPHRLTASRLEDKHFELNFAQWAYSCLLANRLQRGDGFLTLTPSTGTPSIGERFAFRPELKDGVTRASGTTQVSGMTSYG